MDEHHSVEYVIWGVPKGQTADTLLYTRARTMDEARLVMRTLRDTFGARAMRVQMIDLSKPVDFGATFANTVGQ